MGVTSTAIPGIGNTTNGVSIRSAGNNSIAVSRDADVAGYFNRNTSDGNILEFRRSGTNVGSIGVSGGNNIYISGEAALHSGLTFATNEILPTAQGSITDGAESLGSSSNRFNNLYLSGGVYLGGTGAANYLDDYEEGTWTPVDVSAGSLSFTSVNATYVKVGKTVFIAGTLTYPSTADTSQARIAGLPFTSENTSPAISYIIPMTVATSTGAGVAIAIGPNETSGYLRKLDNSVPTNANASGNTFLFSGSYNTA